MERNFLLKTTGSVVLAAMLAACSDSKGVVAFDSECPGGGELETEIQRQLCKYEGEKSEYSVTAKFDAPQRKEFYTLYKEERKNGGENRWRSVAHKIEQYYPNGNMQLSTIYDIKPLDGTGALVYVGVDVNTTNYWDNGKVMSESITSFLENSKKLQAKTHTNEYVNFQRVIEDSSRDSNLSLSV